MKQLKYFFFLPASVILLAISCSKNTESTDLVGNWITRSQLNGDARYEAASFVIGDTAYIATGYNGTDRYKDMWAYRADNNSWTLKAAFAGVARNSAVGFAISGKGYITTGYDGAKRLKDTWEYNPATNAWTSKAAFPEPINAGTGNSDGRYDATAFTLTANGVARGFVTCGYNGGSQKDMYSYNPITDTWKEETATPGAKRSGAVAFIFNNVAYLLTGASSSSNINDFYKYEPNTGVWTELQKLTNISTDGFDDDYTDIVRTNAVAFVMGTKGILAVGENGGLTSKTWEYDFATDRWRRKHDFERASRTGALGFTIKGRGFVTTGRSTGLPFDDIEELQPDLAFNAND
ncbi:MAG: galactose oxidase [Deinococcales bacterium]|nr:galactose oxidase [Chitinophagaceae bacterium]